MKATDLEVTLEFLESRVNPNYPKAKWITFCETLMESGLDLTLTLYEARRTVSKYISVHYKNKEYKVRFSNHRPIAHRELLNDCDFFVGVTNFKVTRTENAIQAVFDWIKEIDAE